ncbi:MAG: response regulator [Prolixibacteraceae bacterium]|nr:response regulator [Prolixibacteraceae bacterium]
MKIKEKIFLFKSFRPILMNWLVFSFIIFINTKIFASNTGFNNINNIFGISIREANSVVKDNYDFIWVSSKTGILRLTDDDYRIYQLPYETANVISVKLNYDNSKLFALTNNGQIFIYNEISDRFELIINMSKEMNDNHLVTNDMILDTEGNYWLASSSGVLKYDNKSIVTINNDSIDVQRIIRKDNENILLSVREGLYNLNIKTLKKELIYKATEIDPLQTSMLDYDKDENKLWVGTVSKGLMYYDFSSKQLKRALIKSLPLQPILAIESISKNSLLLGIDGQGLWEIDKRTFKVLNVYKENSDNISSLRGNGVYDILCDENNRVWVCTYSGGVSYFDQASPIVTRIMHQINNPNSLVNNDINDILEDSRGNTWFATNNGISCLDATGRNWKSFYADKQEQAQVFLTLEEDNNGRIWAGSYSSGVYILDGTSGRQLAHYSQSESNSPFINDFVFDIYKDSQGDMWIGGINKEVIRYISRDESFRKYSIQPIYVLNEYNKGEMLFGCTYGLLLSNNETGEIKTLINGCLVMDVLVLDGIIWVGTIGDGLLRHDPENGTIEKFTTSNGLPSNFVNSVAWSDGYLWLGTESGMCRFDPLKKNVLIYSSISSLSNNSFNRNAHCKLKNGNIAWGTSNGVVIFNPATIQQLQPEGKIFLQDISISGRSMRDYLSMKIDKPLNQLDKIKLKYNQNTLNIELVPIGVAAGSKFSWKMEGLDDDWSLPVSQRILNYSNIPSKEYKLKIRLYDNSLSQVLAERTLAIKITPPFWVTWWFLAILLVLISSIAYFILWNYINQLKQLHTEEKVKFFTNTAHDMRTSLTLIKAPVEELSKEKNLSVAGRHFLHIAIEQTRRLSSVVNQLMEFQKVDIGKGQLSLNKIEINEFIRYRLQMFESIAKGKGIKLIFNSNVKEYITSFDEMMMMEKVIDNLISNAVKYSNPDSEVILNLNCDETKWVLEVIDQGIGIGKKEQRQLFKEFFRAENAVNSKIVGSGIGLLLVKNYVNLHGGQVSFSSQENTGSSFQISIPFREITGEAKFNFTSNSDDFEAEVTIESDIKAENQNNEVSKEMRILVVEDNDDLLQFMKYALSDEFEVITSNDGIPGWEAVQKHLPDLVISDVMMPDMDGFELCRLIKSTYETSHIPVVLLTALSGRAEQLQGLGLGADDYLTKPFDLILLKQKIKTIIQNREIVREKALKINKTGCEDHILNNELNDCFLKKVMEVVNNNISNAEFTKDDFASAMNVSSSLLYKKIKSLTGQSPVDFIKIVRLENALKLIQSKQHTITEISEMCGFSSIGYFSTVFKKHFGKSPTEIVD